NIQIFGKCWIGLGELRRKVQASDTKSGEAGWKTTSSDGQNCRKRMMRLSRSWNNKTRSAKRRRRAHAAKSSPKLSADGLRKRWARLKRSGALTRNWRKRLSLLKRESARDFVHSLRPR